MNKKIVFTVLGSLVIIVAAVGFIMTKNNDSTSSVNANETAIVAKTTALSQQNSQSDEIAASTNISATAGSYVDYSDTVIANTAGTKLLFFHAPWCTQCRAIEKDIKEKGLPAGVTVIKVDYDSHQDLRKKYGVTLQTTFVKIDDSGNKMSSYVSYEEPQFSAVKRELL